MLLCVWLLIADDSRLRRYASASVIDETAVWETRCRHQSASAFRHEFAVSGSPHESDALIVGNVGSGVDWFSFGPMDAVQFLSELLPSWPLRFPIRVELIGIIVSGISARGWNGPNELRRGFGIHCGSSAGCRLAKALDYGWRGGYVANWLCRRPRVLHGGDGGFAAPLSAQDVQLLNHPVIESEHIIEEAPVQLLANWVPPGFVGRQHSLLL